MINEDFPKDLTTERITGNQWANHPQYVCSLDFSAAFVKGHFWNIFSTYQHFLQFFSLLFGSNFHTFLLRFFDKFLHFKTKSISQRKNDTSLLRCGWCLLMWHTFAPHQQTAATPQQRSTVFSLGCVHACMCVYVYITFVISSLRSKGRNKIGAFYNLHPTTKI